MRIQYSDFKPVFVGDEVILVAKVSDFESNYEIVLEVLGNGFRMTIAVKNTLGNLVEVGGDKILWGKTFFQDHGPDYMLKNYAISKINASIAQILRNDAYQAYKKQYVLAQ